ncbi:MAG: HAMP domain-containing histidine kinase [Oscillospiraceae bacterium]|jgi:signal transduction histidine kinase|nr:HAMP domain-containing histidine kinase [Oscillospiraceae bacterium]
MKKIRSKTNRHGLVRRWIVDVLLLVAVTLGIAAGIFMIMFADTYTTLAERRLKWSHSAASDVYFAQRVQVVGKTLRENEKTAQNGVFTQLAKEYMESFNSKGQLELWIIDAYGNVAATSSGTDCKLESIPGYDTLIASGKDDIIWKGKLNDEPVLVYAVRIFGGNTNFDAAMWYCISMQEFNHQIALTGIVVFCVWLFIVAIAVGSGYFFVASIFKPLREISRVTARIRNGDYAARIDILRHHDEIMQLGDDINEMAEAIGSAEERLLGFVSTVSHELFTPLTSIKGWSETLAETQDIDRETHNRGLSIIVDESVRLSKLVEDLMDYSKLRSNRLVFNKERIDVLAELDDVMFLFQDRAMRDGIALQYTSADFAAPMIADPARVRQVFMNLLDNAFKYTPVGGVVTVITQGDPPQLSQNAAQTQQFSLKPPTCLLVTIKDTGAGVPEEELPQLTERFFKASNAVKGTGIGLSVVSEILRAHDCDLQLHSKLGDGLTITIRFPLLIFTQEQQKGTQND